MKKQHILHKANFTHITKLAQFYGVSNTAMLNAVLLGHFHNELLAVVENG